MEGSCEHSNELSDSIKCWEVLKQLHNWRLLDKGSAACNQLLMCNKYCHVELKVD
jgi:hypothetical protein